MEKKPIFGITLQFGLLTGLVLIAFTLVMFIAGVNEKSPIQLISIVLYAGMLYWGIVIIRDRQLEGVMNYGKAFGAGFWITLFAAILVGVFMFFYLKYINPGFIKDHLIEAEQKMQDKDFSQEQIDQIMRFYKVILSPIINAIMSFIWDVIIGTLFSLIIAIFAKREDKTIA